MNDYSEATLRARIQTVIEGVAETGNVHDYQRWLADWTALRNLFEVTISGKDQIRGWMISLENMTQTSETFMGGGGPETIQVTYQYLIKGFLGVDDSAETEKTMVTLALAIGKALTEDSVLETYALDLETPPVRIGSFSYRMFAGILAHYVELRIALQEAL